MTDPHERQSKNRQPYAGPLAHSVPPVHVRSLAACTRALRSCRKLRSAACMSAVRAAHSHHTCKLRPFCSWYRSVGPSASIDSNENAILQVGPCKKPASTSIAARRCLTPGCQLYIQPTLTTASCVCSNTTAATAGFAECRAEFASSLLPSA